MDTTRRDFLRRSAACAAIVGFSDSWLSRQEGAERATSRPARWAACLEQMKKERRPGLVIRFPDQDIQQVRLAQSLEGALKLRRGPDYGPSVPTKPAKTVIAPDVVWVFLGSVVVAMEGAAVKELIPGAKPNDRLILIDEKGSRIDGSTPILEDLYMPTGLVQPADALLNGEGCGRLRERAERSALPRRAYETIQDSSPKAVASLRESFPDKDLVAVLYYQYVSSSGFYARNSLAEVMGAYYDAEKHPLAGHSLPFGVEIVGKEEPADPCPPCGMAVAPPSSRKFVGILQSGANPKKQ